MLEHILKGVGGILIFVSIVVFGLIPFWVKSFRKNKLLLSLSNCFSGGLFLAMGLIHILPEAAMFLENRPHKHIDLLGKALKKPIHIHIHSHKHSHDHDHGHDHGHSSAHEDGKNFSGCSHPFPLSYFICLVFFSFILLVDKVFSQDSEDDQRKKKEGVAEVPHSGSNAHDKAQLADLTKNISAEIDKRQSLGTDKVLKTYDNHIHKDNNDHLHDHNNNTNIISVEKVEKIYNHDHTHIHTNDHHHDHAGHDHDDESLDNSHHHDHMRISSKTTFFKAYLLILALSVHNIFCGVAFGMAKTKKQILYMFLGMILHKWSEALSVGINIFKAGIPKNRAVWMIMFLALLNTAGMVIGWMFLSSNETIAGVSMALSAGTFLYMSCAETITEEFHSTKNKYIKSLAYVSGIALVSVLVYFE